MRLTFDTQFPIFLRLGGRAEQWKMSRQPIITPSVNPRMLGVHSNNDMSHRLRTYKLHRDRLLPSSPSSPETNGPRLTQQQRPGIQKEKHHELPTFQNPPNRGCPARILLSCSCGPEPMHRMVAIRLRQDQDEREEKSSFRRAEPSLDCQFRPERPRQSSVVANRCKRFCSWCAKREEAVGCVSFWIVSGLHSNH
jgi:hypothetical protein